MDDQTWKKAILSVNSRVKDVIRSLELSGTKISLIVNPKDKFIGTITDGDIRRFIIKKTNINEPIKNLVKKKCLTIPNGLNKNQILKLMEKHKVNQIPIVDKYKNIHGLVTLEEILSIESKKNIFFIMAGGKGLRLGDLTKDTPKPMLKVGNKPMIERVISNAKKNGFNNFLLSVNYKKNKIINYFKNGSKFDIKINYIKEDNNKPLGTAGSLSYLPKTELPVIVSNADVISDIDYGDLLNFHYENKSHFTVVTASNEIETLFGQVELKNNKIVGIKEKPIIKIQVAAGIYVINSNLTKYVKRGAYLNMNELILKLIKKNKKIFSYSINGSWSDLGSKEDFISIQNKYN